MIGQPPFRCTATPRVSTPGTPLSMACHPVTAVRDADDLDNEAEKGGELADPVLDEAVVEDRVEDD
jgi:hypothetical protein